VNVRILNCKLPVNFFVVKKNMIDLIYAREKTSIWVKDCLSDKLFDIFAPEVELWGFLSLAI
jgi:hypothetical protein